MKQGKLSRICRWAFLGLAGVLLYGGMIWLLALSEGRNPDSSIQGVADAFWYSLVTLSTVGYGDMYPVTLPGRMIGFCFILMSLGVLAFIMGAIINFMTGRLLPALRLRLVRSREWFVFADANMESLVLAEDLEKSNPQGVFLFPKGESDALIGEKGYHAYAETIAQTVAGKRKDCTLFFIGEAHGQYQKAVEALLLGFPVVCRTEHMPDSCPKGLTLYNRYDGCAQEYWRNFIPGKDEKLIVLIGGGRYGNALLEWGLTVNIFAPGSRICYHMFGEWADFRRNHRQLELTLAVDGESPDKDSVFFHKEAWNEDAELLKKADRIILCSEADEDNVTVLRQIRKYFPTQANIHIRAGSDVPGEWVFGMDKELYTSELVLRGKQAKAARLLHQIYVDNYRGTAPAWEELNDFTRRSNIAAAEHMLIKVRLLLEDESITEITAENCRAAYKRYCEAKDDKIEDYRRIEHLRWLRFHSLFNWQYAPVRDNEARKHSMMLPYEELSAAEQEKDDYSWKLLQSMADYLAAEM